jgi:putative transposase
MEFIHVLNRGVDKRTIFLDDKDYYRFVHDLFEFNDSENVSNVNYFFNKNIDIECRYVEKKKRKLLVDIHAFCLMPNHYHILLSPRIDGGIPIFMKKLNMGYSKYFNEKYKRTGTLFQGRYKSVQITKDAHFIHIPYYIHLNPLDIITKKWRTGDMKDTDKAIKFLQNYRWSSFLDYSGKKNFPSVTRRDFLLKFFGSPDRYIKDTIGWLKERESINNIRSLISDLD